MSLAVLTGATVPHAGEQGIPPCVRVQVTPAFVASFRTVAVSSCATFMPMRTEVGETETEIGGGGITVNVAEADLVVSATEVAVIVTIAFAGTVAGAV